MGEKEGGKKRGEGGNERVRNLRRGKEGGKKGGEGGNERVRRE